MGMRGAETGFPVFAVSASIGVPGMDPPSDTGVCLYSKATLPILPCRVLPQTRRHSSPKLWIAPQNQPLPGIHPVNSFPQSSSMKCKKSKGSIPKFTDSHDQL